MLAIGILMLCSLPVIAVFWITWILDNEWEYGNLPQAVVFWFGYLLWDLLFVLQLVGGIYLLDHV